MVQHAVFVAILSLVLLAASCKGKVFINRESIGTGPQKGHDSSTINGPPENSSLKSTQNGKELTALGTDGVRTSLFLILGGNGKGDVTSSVSTESCLDDCTTKNLEAPFVDMEFTATASAGSYFESWRGLCEGEGPCTVSKGTVGILIANFGADRSVDWLCQSARDKLDEMIALKPSCGAASVPPLDCIDRLKAVGNAAEKWEACIDQNPNDSCTAEAYQEAAAQDLLHDCKLNFERGLHSCSQITTDIQSLCATVSENCAPEYKNDPRCPTNSSEGAAQ